jgi:hypothetical protein
MLARDAWMLMLRTRSIALFTRPVDRELWTNWNPLTRFWVPLVHHTHGGEPLAVMRWA